MTLTRPYPAHPRLRLTPPLTDLLWFTLLSWAGLTVAVSGIAVGVAVVGDLDRSIVELATGLVPWYVAIIAGHVAHEVLPLHVAHGQTRREFGRLACVFLALLSLLSATLVAVGYLVERVLYEIGGWPHRLTEDHLYASAVESHRVLVDHGLAFLVWSSVGALVGAAYYRFGAAGSLALVAGLLPLAVVESAAGGSSRTPVDLVDRVGLDASPPLAVGVLLGLAAAAATLAATWRIVRDVPVLPRGG